MRFPKPIRKKDPDLLAARRAEGCWICGKQPCDASHIKTRGSGGPDEDWNVVAKCRIHHIEWGQLGPIKFCAKYPAFALRLLALGWEIHSYGLRHPRSRPDESDPSDALK